MSSYPVDPSSITSSILDSSYEDPQSLKFDSVCITLVVAAIAANTLCALSIWRAKLFKTPLFGLIFSQMLNDLIFGTWVLFMHSFHRAGGSTRDAWFDHCTTDGFILTAVLVYGVTSHVAIGIHRRLTVVDEFVIDYPRAYLFIITPALLGILIAMSTYLIDGYIARVLGSYCEPDLRRPFTGWFFSIFLSIMVCIVIFCYTTILLHFMKHAKMLSKPIPGHRPIPSSSSSSSLSSPSSPPSAFAPTLQLKRVSDSQTIITTTDLRRQLGASGSSSALNSVHIHHHHHHHHNHHHPSNDVDVRTSPSLHLKYESQFQMDDIAHALPVIAESSISVAVVLPPPPSSPSSSSSSSSPCSSSSCSSSSPVSSHRRASSSNNNATTATTTTTNNNNNSGASRAALAAMKNERALTLCTGAIVISFLSTSTPWFAELLCAVSTGHFLNDMMSIIIPPFALLDLVLSPVLVISLNRAVRSSFVTMCSQVLSKLVVVLKLGGEGDGSASAHSMVEQQSTVTKMEQTKHETRRQHKKNPDASSLPTSPARNITDQVDVQLTSDP